MKPFPILLVDDDELEIKATQQAFKQAQLGNPLYAAGDGLEALAFLRRAPPYSKDNAPRPGLILLDLDMPRMTGLEFLKVRNEQLALRAIPVVVMTTTTEQRSRIEAYNLGVAGYLVKPMDFNQFVKACQVIHAYWCLCAPPS